MTAIAWSPIASSLSRREKQVLGALLTGKSQPAIARDWWVSTKTVEAHVANIRRKLEDQGLELIHTYQIQRKG